MKKNTFLVLGAAILVGSAAMYLNGCGKASSALDLSSNESVTEIATAALSGVAGTSANTDGAVAMLLDSTKKETLWALFEHSLPLIPEALAATAPCPSLFNTGSGGVANGQCAVTGTAPSAVMTLTYPSGCGFLKNKTEYYDATFSGGPLVFTQSVGSTTPACGNFSIFANGNTVTQTWTTALVRTITKPGTSISLALSVDTAASGYDKSISGGVKFAIAGLNRTISILGKHLKATTSAAGASKTVWDHTIATGDTYPGAGSNAITIAGASFSPGAGVGYPSGPHETRTVNGTMITEHNLAKYTATTTYTNVIYSDTALCIQTDANSKHKDLGTGKTTCTLTFSGTTPSVADNGCAASATSPNTAKCYLIPCPHPIDGTASTTFVQGSTTNTETITFTGKSSNTCGNATFSQGSGPANPLALIHVI